jgi:hypothetical protein
VAVKFARARQFIEAVAVQDLKASIELPDPDVETVTPRGTLRGIGPCRQVLQKASGDEQSPRNRRSLISKTLTATSLPGRIDRSLARNGEVAYERDFAVRLTLNDDRIIRIVVMPGAPPSQANGGSRAV